MPKQQVGKECVSCATSRGRMRILIHMNTRRKKEKELQLFQKGRNAKGTEWQTQRKLQVKRNGTMENIQTKENQ